MIKKSITFIVCLSLFFLCCSCIRNNNSYPVELSDATIDSINYLNDILPLYDDGEVNVVVEIPSGTLEKWEVDKSDGKLHLESIGNKSRIVNYLGYPGNYGFIPRTLLSKENGGDGDPLDILILGPPMERGSIIKCKIIGVLYLLDIGEKDDKLIAVQSDSPLYEVKSIVDLDNQFVGISEIIELWFTNYKGPGKMVSKGFGDLHSAKKILNTAIKEYQQTI